MFALLAPGKRDYDDCKSKNRDHGTGPAGKASAGGVEEAGEVGSRKKCLLSAAV